jgi:predicted nucleotidyltransferase
VNKKDIKKICQEFGLSFVVLFGSRASGKRGFKEDYDIGAFSPHPVKEKEKLALICRFSQILGSDALDLVFLNQSPPLLCYEVATTGRLLYERDEGSFDRFRWQALQRWNDTKKFYAQNRLYIEDYVRETR